MYSPFFLYFCSNVLLSLGNAVDNLLRLSGRALYVDVVMNFTPISLNSFNNSPTFSFTPGMIGSTRTITGIPLEITCSSIEILFEGAGALGSYLPERVSSFVLIVTVTAKFSGDIISRSRNKISDFVTNKTLKPYSTNNFNVWRVKPRSFSIVGYGSELLAIEIGNDLSAFFRSHGRCLIKSNFGLQWNACGIYVVI